MKTLNEVIDYAQMIVPMKDASDTKDMWASIEHYLKEYREKKEVIARRERRLEQTIESYEPTNEIKMLQEMLDSELEWHTEQLRNDPLTWEELRQMEGKPIWIELLNHDIWEDPSHRVDSEWWVIGEVRKDDIILATYLDEMELCEEDIGVLWQAYRKERK